MKYTVITLFLLFTHLGYAQKKPIILTGDALHIKYSTSELKEPYLYRLKNGKLLNGSYKLLILTERQNEVQLVGNFSNGLKEGIVTLSVNNRISLQAKYCKGKPCGEFKRYYSNGKLSESKVFNANQKLHGAYKNYRQIDGKILRQTEYLNGLKNGEQKKFYTNKNGFVSLITTYKDGNKDGKEIGYRPDGRVSFIAHYKNDVYDGKYISYFDNGAVEMEMFYKNGKLSGTVKGYTEKGKKSVLAWKREYFKNNLIIWTTYNTQDNSINKVAYLNDGTNISKEEFEKLKNES